MKKKVLYVRTSVGLGHGAVAKPATAGGGGRRLAQPRTPRVPSRGTPDRLAQPAGSLQNEKKHLKTDL